MASGFRLGWAAALGLTGCASVPPLDNPMLINKTAEPVENPVIVFPGIPNGESYRKVREKCLNVLTSYKFEILTADSRDGLIITNNHVVEGGTDIVVALSDKREFKAKVLGADARTDVALLKIEGANLPWLTMGDS